MRSKDPSKSRPPTTLEHMNAPEPGMAHGAVAEDDLELSDPHERELLDPSSTDPAGPFDHVRVPRDDVRTSPWIGKKLGGRYAIVGTLGKGGAGHVFRAVQEPLGREVAVKVLRTDLPPVSQKTFADRFLREAALAGRLAHPALVTVHDYGHQDQEADGVPAGTRWVVMELLDGRTLWHRIKRDGPLPPREAARIGAALARGLRHAHVNGLVHRDVKPNNVVLVPDDDGVEQPKLVDFGLVKPAAGEGEMLTEVGRYMGTPAYMAPEQAEGTDVDGRADQYALGCVLYHMLSGVVPFDSNTPLGVAVQHKTDAVPPISRRSGVAVAPALEVVVRKAMAKAPDDRYPDCGALADALEGWLQGLEPPKAAPRRPWGLFLGAAALVVVLLGGGALAVVAGGAGVAVGLLSQGPGLEHDPTPPVPLEVPSDDGVAAVEPVDSGAPEVEVEPEVEPEPAPAPVAPKPAPVVPKAAPDPVPAAPKPPPAPAPVAPKPAPPPPKPVPEAEPVPPGMVRFDDVVMTPDDARAAVAWVNAATPQQLEAAGVYQRGVEVVMANRPFADMTAFANTKYVGTKTIEAALKGAGRR